jgi:thiol-disulfide isomerase/thioredoxin
MRSVQILTAAMLLGLAELLAATGAAAELVLPDLNGKVHRLSDYRGKWVLVNYWATWCPPCLEELPELEVFHSNNSATRAMVLGVNMEDISEKRLRSFVADQFLSFPILVATAEPEHSLGSVPGLPTSFLVNPAGEVVARQVGPVTAEAIERYIDRYEARTQERPEVSQ